VDEKVYSIFETHTDLITRGKARKPVEFGHKVFLAESAQGLIAGHQLLEGNPAGSAHVAPSLERHQKTFQQTPELYAGDRGFDSVENQEKCRVPEIGSSGFSENSSALSPQNAVRDHLECRRRIHQQPGLQQDFEIRDPCFRRYIQKIQQSGEVLLIRHESPGPRYRRHVGTGDEQGIAIP